MTSKASLAIVIPAFKREFLADTLRSLGGQSDQRFQVYVFDDASPEDLESVVQAERGILRIEFVRFEAKKGGRDLVGQWMRCLDEITEDWIWLFSDDDVLEANCVERFYEALEAAPDADVFRFNTVFIDEEGRVVRVNPPHPGHESWQEFAYHLLKGNRVATIQEVVFRRERLREVGGFVPFPLAWCSDHATTIALALDRGLEFIAGAKVRFRWSGINISSARSRDLDVRKIEAARKFCHWLNQLVRAEGSGPLELPPAVLLNSSRDWLLQHLQHIKIAMRPSEIGKIRTFLRDEWGDGAARSAWASTKAGLYSAGGLMGRVIRQIRRKRRGK